MSWFSRPKEMAEALGPTKLVSGVYRSPGLARLGKELDHRRPEAILDLGASSTENVKFLSRYSTNLCIQDMFHSACEAGLRSQAFDFGAADELQLPAGGERFDVVLMWDLIHYFQPTERRRFIRRLRAHCRQDALVFLIASSSASIPLAPIRFRVESSDSLHYTLPEGDRLEPATLRTRQVEGLMKEFSPLRFFQLRTGFQEFLFRYEGGEEEEEEEAAAASPPTDRESPSGAGGSEEPVAPPWESGGAGK